MGCSPPGSSVHGDSPGQYTGVGSHALLQGIFLTQGLNPGLPHSRQMLYPLSHQGRTSLFHFTGNKLKEVSHVPSVRQVTQLTKARSRPKPIFLTPKTCHHVEDFLKPIKTIFQVKHDIAENLNLKKLKPELPLWQTGQVSSILCSLFSRSLLTLPASRTTDPHPRAPRTSAGPNLCTSPPPMQAPEPRKLHKS